MIGNYTGDDTTTVMPDVTAYSKVGNHTGNDTTTMMPELTSYSEADCSGLLAGIPPITPDVNITGTIPLRMTSCDVMVHLSPQEGHYLRVC